MDKLVDYVQWMGDFPVEATGLQDADALVLCAIAYFDLRPLLAEGDAGCTVRDCMDPLERGELHVAVTGSVEGFYELLREAAKSKRYGALRISDYVDILEQEPPLQFSAMCFHGEGWSFLAYRGTDSSLAGWKEDFLISVARTRAQELALLYAGEHLTGEQKWYIGGHSKGGNLSLYAASMMDSKKWEKVERLYLLDGPGFCPDVLNPESLSRVDAKTRRVIPHFSVVGKLFEPRMTDTRIVNSFAHGFLQHGIETWGVDHGKLALAKESDPACLWIQETLSSWIGNLTQNERIHVIDDLFDALAAGGASTLNEINIEGKAGREAILKKLGEMSFSAKQSLSDLPKVAVRAGMRGLKELIADELASRGIELPGLKQTEAEALSTEALPAEPEHEYPVGESQSGEEA